MPTYGCADDFNPSVTPVNVEFMFLDVADFCIVDTGLNSPLTNVT